MIGRVPLARRALFQDRRRAGLAAGAVAAALVLVLLLQGIVDGATREVTAYLRSLPAQVIVSEQGVRTMHMSVSTLAPDTPAAVGRVNGVAWAEGIRYAASVIVAPGGGQELVYIFGYDTGTGRGGPQKMAAGRAPRSGDIVLDKVGAGRLGVRIDDTVSVFGVPFRVSGLSRTGTTISNSTAFITNADFAARRGPSFAYVLVGAQPGIRGNDLAHRLAAALPTLTVQTRARFVHEETALVNDMMADLIRLMSVAGFLVALAVIGLTLFALTLAKLHEHAIVKALGGRTRRLAMVVLTQAAWSVGLALALATVVAVGLGALVSRTNPAIAVAVEPASVIRAGLGALTTGVLGALLPLRRVVAVDPASAFGRAS